ncbi:hypothetical protein AXW83_12240 [Bosea sp. PAMC 26642]|nr:hypothetical protein AXW83_12240 [Bosea sp. PAMC 26642]
MRPNQPPPDLAIGDRVFLALDRNGAGEFEIIRIMPPAVDGGAQYRVRGNDGLERAIGQHQVLRVASRAVE